MVDITKDECRDLLKSYLSILPPRWAAMQTYIAMYFTLISAILAFSFTQLDTFVKEGRIALLSLPFFVVSLIAFFAVSSVRKQDKHIKELIVFIAKLEHAIGLYGLDESKADLKPWPLDPHFLTPRWVKARLTSGPESEGFINAPLGGTARHACQIFGFLGIVGLTLAIAALLAQLKIVSL